MKENMCQYASLEKDIHGIYMHLYKGNIYINQYIY